MPNGSVRWVRSQISAKKDEKTEDIIAVIAYVDDVHDSKIKEEELKRKAQIDPLVGAFNKKATEAHIKAHLNKHKAGVMFMIDLDNFKSINDNFGHKYGDEVLKEVYDKIARHFRAKDIIGRVGGDEFVAFSLNNIKTEEIERKAGEICKSINKTYSVDDVHVEISSSIGVAISPEHGKVFDELYHKADMAMYERKKKSKNGYSIFNKDVYA